MLTKYQALPHKEHHHTLSQTWRYVFIRLRFLEIYYRRKTQTLQRERGHDASRRTAPHCTARATSALLAVGFWGLFFPFFVFFCIPYCLQSNKYFSQKKVGFTLHAIRLKKKLTKVMAKWVTWLIASPPFFVCMGFFYFFLLFFYFILFL